MPDLTLERWYAELRAKQRSHEEGAKEAKEEADKIEAVLLERWIKDGCNRIQVDGTLLYMQDTTFVVMPEGKDSAVALLQGSQYADMVQATVNTNTLSALVRELEEGEGLPDDWKGVIEAGRRTNVRTRKAD